MDRPKKTAGKTDQLAYIDYLEAQAAKAMDAPATAPRPMTDARLVAKNAELEKAGDQYRRTISDLRRRMPAGN